MTITLLELALLTIGTVIVAGDVGWIVVSLVRVNRKE